MHVVTASYNNTFPQLFHDECGKTLRESPERYMPCWVFSIKRGENLETKIVQGEIRYLDVCLEALMHSELACNYLPDEKVAKNHLVEAFERKEMYLALDSEGKCVGYIRFVLNGAFYDFPYVCNISVKENFRGRGIGKRLLGFFEDISFAHYDKVFLLVSSFNEQAKKLYESIGYNQVGVINDLYKDGISEYIMMKAKSL